MFQNLLTALILTPVIGFIGCVLSSRKKEQIVFSLAVAAMLAELVLFLWLSYHWLSTGMVPIFDHAITLYGGSNYTFALDFYFDKLAVVFLGVATITAILVMIFSKFYMHREPGFKRFYSTLLLFFVGLSLIILAGNFEVLFVGWEFIGISSVLLIAFYRDRFLPARNALKVFSVYRVADAFLLTAIWYAHHLFEKNINFSEYSGLVAQHGDKLALLGLLFLMAALVKSAQYPFSYWLPRAMEGPTTSSAIFYGALSVHMGLFLMFRTYPLWEGSLSLRIAIAGMGLATALIASSITRVQSSIKTQIAYASITQIGIMFVELAAGLHWLVLLHFTSNALLRTYQLLISPSIVGYLVHDQFFNFVSPAPRIKNNLIGKLRATVYVLSIKEWNMNTGANTFIWRPLKSIGRIFAFLDSLAVQAVVAVLFLIAAFVTAGSQPASSLTLVISSLAALLSVVFYIRAYTIKGSAAACWNLILLGHLFGMLFLSTAANGSWKYLTMYGVAVAAAFLMGHLCLRYMVASGESNTLREYQGSMYVLTKLGQLFFIISLLFMAFPISPSFLSQDILLSLIPRSHVIQVFFFGISYLMVGVSVMRLYVKLFFGPHKTSYHEVAYKSS